MRLKFYGVRAGIPISHARFAAVGTNTPCVAIHCSDSAPIILNAGTGIIALGHELMADDCGQGRGQLTIVVTQPTMDHIEGLPFFAPLHVPGNRIQLVSLTRAFDLTSVLDAYLSHSFSPLQTIGNFAAQIDVRGVAENELVSRQGTTIRCLANSSSGIEAAAVHISHAKSNLAFVPFPPTDIRAAESLCENSSTILYGCIDPRWYFGDGAAIQQNDAPTIISAGIRQGVTSFIASHFSPEESDGDVAAFVERHQSRLAQGLDGKNGRVLAAREGATVDLS